MYLVGALVGVYRLEVVHVAHHRVLEGDPVGAEHAARLPRHLEGGAATVRQILDTYEIALHGFYPDLTVILDLPAEVGLARLPGQPDRMEAKGLEFHQKVRELFAAQAATAPESFTVLDAAGSVDDVQQRLRSAIENWNSPN